MYCWENFTKLKKVGGKKEISNFSSVKVSFHVSMVWLFCSNAVAEHVSVSAME